MLLGGDAQELPQRVRVAERAMARLAADAVARDHAVEIVAALARIQALRQLHAADRARLEPDAGAVELTSQKPIVEARVVRDEDPAGEALAQLVGELGEGRRAGEHGV